VKIYQLHLDGKNRAKHNFKTREEALEHKNRLIRYTIDRINEGQLGYRSYLAEARALEIAEIEKKSKIKTYSVCEYQPRASGIVKHFNDLEAANNYMRKLQEDSKRIYGVMESSIND